MSQLLHVRGLTRRFGGLVAVYHVDFQVTEGEILTYRPQRRGQDHNFQSAGRVTSSKQRFYRFERQRYRRSQATSNRCLRPNQNFPERYFV